MTKHSNQKDSASADHSPGTVIATMVRGSYFDYDGTVWSREAGTIAHRVVADTADYLQRTAFDVVGMLDGENGPEPIIKPKFSFSEASA